MEVLYMRMVCGSCGAGIRVTSFPAKVKCPVCTKLHEFLQEIETDEPIELHNWKDEVDLEFNLVDEE